MTRIITITNNKGGVAKTTSTLNIGKGLANKNKKVLLIDLDPQASLTKAIGITPTSEKLKNRTITQVLEDKISITETIIPIENIYLIASNLLLSFSENKFSNYFMLKRKLEPIKNNFDYILIDTPPSLNNLTMNGLIASDDIYIPIQAEYMALEGTQDLIAYFHTKVEEENNPNFKINISKVFLTMTTNSNLSKDIENQVRDYFKEKCFKTKIRRNITLAEAPTQKICIFDYDKSSNGAKDYENLVNEILESEVYNNEQKLS